MKAYLLRRRSLGRSSVRGIIAFSKEGIEGYRSDGMKHQEGGYAKSELPADADLCIRWGCTATVPTKRVLNEAAAIHYVSDKATSRKAFADAGLAPRTFLSLSAFLAAPFYPAVVRPPVHSQGRNIDLCANEEQVRTACAKYGAVYISEFIDKIAEYRVFAMQGRVVWVARKTPADPKALAWNVAQGGHFDNVRWGDWDMNVVKVGLTAFNMTGLDFGGVDVMVDQAGRAYVLEINSAPSQTSPYRQECCARAFDHLLQTYGTRGKERYDIEGWNWKGTIHPGLLKTIKKGDSE